MRRRGSDAQGLLRQLETLVAHPREDLHIEVKSWLDPTDEEHKADLAKAMLALANSGGGYVLIGFTRQDTGYVPQQPRPQELRIYSHDTVNAIVRSYAEPPFHCEVYHVQNVSTGELFPIVVIPGGHRVPIRAKRDGPNRKHVRVDTYYIRRPGPTSEPIQTAQEWDDLLRRCILVQREELLDGFRAILLGRPSSSEAGFEAASKVLDEWVSQSRIRWKEAVIRRLGETGMERYQYGTWTVAYVILGDFPTPSSPHFLELLWDVQGQETGWPPWWVPTRDPVRPYAYEGVVECLMAEYGDPGSFSDGAHSDFWRASREGKLFLLRGYEDDGEDAQRRRVKPGTVFDSLIPVWRVAECLLHAHRLATKLAGPSASVLIRFTWEGLADRVLLNWTCPQRHLSYARRCYQGTVTSEFAIPASNIIDQLPEAVKEATNPLYEAFDFFEMPLDVIRDILRNMRRERS